MSILDKYLLLSYIYQMNYQKHYNRLIAKALSRPDIDQCETHHIIPVCMGGSNDKANLVNLTPEEHFLAHQLLIKLYPDNRKLLFAARMMSVSPNGTRINNKQYGWIKRKISKAGHSEETKIKMSISHTGSKRSDETKLKMSTLQKERGGYGPKVFTEDHKLKLSVSQKGKHSKPKTEIHKRNLSIALTGKEKTLGFTNKKHSDISRDKMSKSQLCKELEPWETGPVVSNQNCLRLWKDLDVVYNAWVETGFKGHRRICSYMNIPLQSSVENMIKWFRKNGNPLNSNKWLNFKQGNTKCKIP
jgi:hypothetical protein